MNGRYQNGYRGNRYRKNNKNYDDDDIKKIIDEAVLITKELGNNIAFVGAVAVYLHTKNRSRVTHDLDFAAASYLSDGYLQEKGYIKREERGKPVTRTPIPRQAKIDIYRKDVGEIPVQYIIDTATNVSVSKNKNKKNDKIVRIANLEVLIVTKHRSPRDQDGTDLQDIATTRFSQIGWTFIRSLAKSDYEFQEIKNKMAQYNKMG